MNTNPLLSETQHSYTSIQETILAWQPFLATIDWHILIQSNTPLHGGCGAIYELPNFLNRSNEDLCIADMRTITYAQPHYHPTGNTEIYFVLAGTAMVVVGEKTYNAQKGDVIIIEPNIAHFTIPDSEYVIAVVHTPPFKPENYIVVEETNLSVRFDRAQFDMLIAVKESFPC